MNKRTVLKFWQVVAIWAIYQFHTGYLRNGVLTDTVSLGKIIVILFLMQFKLNFRNAAGTICERTARYGPAKATMIVVPPTLIPQWINTILEHLLEFTLCLYYRSLVDHSQDQKKRIINRFLHKSWFSEGQDIAKCIILTSYKTMARRHGPKALDMIQRSKFNMHDAAEMKAIKAK
jgi:SNF2 family DNA or RNA helicase